MPTETKLATHAKVIDRVSAQYKDLFESTPQSMYIFVDDHNRVCNENFARLLGYPNAAAWAAVQESFTQAFVDPASQGTLVNAYQAAVQEGVGVRIAVTWRRKDGSKVATQVILVPVDIDGHRVAVHYID